MSVETTKLYSPAFLLETANNYEMECLNSLYGLTHIGRYSNQGISYKRFVEDPCACLNRKALTNESPGDGWEIQEINNRCNRSGLMLDLHLPYHLELNPFSPQGFQWQRV